MLNEDTFKLVRHLEIKTRRLVAETTGGAYRSVFKGRGMEFEEVREYEEGDDIRTIDWNITARMDQPFVKLFREERELTVFLLVDISASGALGSRCQTKRELAIELAALIAFSAIRNKDRVGLILFSDEEELHLPPRKGRRHILRLTRELIAHKPRSKKTDIRKALERYLKSSNKNNVVFLISDLMDWGYEKTLGLTAQKHDLTVMHIADPLEQILPGNIHMNVEDAESGEELFLQTSSKGRTHTTLPEAAALCRKAGASYVHFNCGEDYLKPLMAYFKQREHMS